MAHDPPARLGHPHPAGVDPAYIESVRSGLSALDPFARRCIELACFGGQGAPAIAALLSATERGVREAMRAGLLQIGSSTRRPPP